MLLLVQLQPLQNHRRSSKWNARQSHKQGVFTSSKIHLTVSAHCVTVPSISGSARFLVNLCHASDSSPNLPSAVTTSGGNWASCYRARQRAVACRMDAGRSREAPPRCSNGPILTKTCSVNIKAIPDLEWKK